MIILPHQDPKVSVASFSTLCWLRFGSGLALERGTERNPPRFIYFPLPWAAGGMLEKIASGWALRIVEKWVSRASWFGARPSSGGGRRLPLFF